MKKQSVFMNLVVREFARARQRPIPRLPEPPPSLSIRGEAVRARPAFRCAEFGPPPNNIAERKGIEPRAPQSSVWLSEDCANEPCGFFRCGEQNALWALGSKVALLVLLLAASASSQAAVRAVGAIGLTVGDLDREVEFFTKVLPFEKVSETSTVLGAADELLGLKATQLRSVELRLGEEFIALTEHLTNK